MKEKIEAYKEIVKVLTKHEKILIEDKNDLKERFSSRLEQLYVMELFKIYPDFSIGWGDWVNINNDISFGKFGPNTKRRIAWEDNGKTPGDEWLLTISFPSGPYFFGGRDYPKELFDKFFDELKTYIPKYIDTTNHALYFDHTSAKYIYDEYPNIVKKYQDEYRNIFSDKLKRIKQLEDELNQLKNN